MNLNCTSVHYFPPNCVNPIHLEGNPKRSLLSSYHKIFIKGRVQEIKDWIILTHSWCLVSVYSKLFEERVCINKVLSSSRTGMVNYCLGNVQSLFNATISSEGILSVSYWWWVWLCDLFWPIGCWWNKTSRGLKYTCEFRCSQSFAFAMKITCLGSQTVLTPNTPTLSRSIKLYRFADVWTKINAWYCMQLSFGVISYAAYNNSALLIQTWGQGSILKNIIKNFSIGQSWM